MLFYNWFFPLFLLCRESLIMRIFLQVLISIALVILLCSGVEGNSSKKENKNKSTDNSP